MSGAAWMARAGAAFVAAALVGGGSGCIEVPEPLELDMVIDDAGAAVWKAESEAAPEAVRGRLRSSSSWPAPDHTAWPLSRDPRLAAIDQREVRTYPLWPTPISEPCPGVMFGSFGGLELNGGDMFDRIRARLAAVGVPRLSVSPSEIVPLHDHIDVPGLRLMAASYTGSGCMMGWHHTHCFVTHDDVYCPDGSSKDLERLVRAHGLTPHSLDSAGWFELAVVMTGVETLVIEPRLVRECTRVAGAEAVAPAVEIDPERVTVRFTSIDDGAGLDHTVIVERDGTVRMEAHPRWEVPAEEDIWGAAVGVEEDPLGGLGVDGE
jgi:hypothetical protein